MSRRSSPSPSALYWPQVAPPEPKPLWICIGPAQQPWLFWPEWTPGAVERPWSLSILPMAARYDQPSASSANRVGRAAVGGEVIRRDASDRACASGSHVADDRAGERAREEARDGQREEGGDGRQHDAGRVAVRTRRHQKNSSEKPWAGASRGAGVTTASGSEGGPGGAGRGVRLGSGALSVAAGALRGGRRSSSRLRRGARRGCMSRSS